MSTSLSNQMFRSLYALPLLAAGLCGVLAAETPAVAADADTGAAAATVAFVAQIGCDSNERPVGAAALMRMPGDIGPIATRVRCAQ